MSHTKDEEMFSTEVPAKYQPMVDRLRKFLYDTPETNELMGEEESDDLALYNALRDTLEEINYEYDPVDLHYPSLEKVSWNVLRMGAVLQIMISQGILSARNVLSYQDSGGVSVKHNDKFGRYTVFFNMLTSKYSRQVAAMKRALNVNACFGGVHSPYNDLT